MNHCITKYPTKLIKLINLPIGTKFWVHNGAWEGEVIEKDGRKFIKTNVNEFLASSDYEVEITIL